MQKFMNLQRFLTATGDDTERQLELFALLTLGIVESLENGLLSPAEAITSFFNAANCEFVRVKLSAKAADEVMGRGAQLPDLLETLYAEESQKEFQRKIAAIRRLCLGLLEKHRLVA
jgi:hypothetical protein